MLATLSQGICQLQDQGGTWKNLRKKGWRVSEEDTAIEHDHQGGEQFWVIKAKQGQQVVSCKYSAHLRFRLISIDFSP